MINTNEIIQTIRMIDQQHLDIRTITMGISLLDCWLHGSECTVQIFPFKYYLLDFCS